MNNSRDKLKIGGSGTHWSLLLIDTDAGKSFHFNSLRGTNMRSAQDYSLLFGVSEQNCVELPCEQQRNNFECGVFTLANLRSIVNFFILADRDISFSVWYHSSMISPPPVPAFAFQSLYYPHVPKTPEPIGTTVTETVPKLLLTRRDTGQWRLHSLKKSHKPKSIPPIPEFDLELTNKFSVLDVK